MMCCMLGLALGVHAQESVFLQQYREKVKAYFLPSLSGNANASYTGNPLELYRELPSLDARYQILCHNCNVAKANWGACPHTAQHGRA